MFRTARETLRNSLSRMRNRQFLDATMAATALVSTADGDVTFSELSALDNVLDTIQDLQIYDPHVAVDIYRDFADAIAENPEQGRDTALAAASKIVGDHNAAELVILVAIAISKADGKLSAQESDVIQELCELLGVRIPKDSEIPR
jgi:tellurite resistance protein TerB